MITKKWFAFIIFLSYLLIGIISAFLLYLKFETTIIMSFLEITIPPSVPAFLAIFLSQYSAQAEDTRKGERLKDIQIKKEISESLINHYQLVREGLKKLICEVPVPRKDDFDSFDSLRKIDTKFTNLEYEKSSKMAIMHFKEEFKLGAPTYFEEFEKSEKRVYEYGNKFNYIWENIKIFLEESLDQNQFKVLKSFDSKSKSANVIYGKEVFFAVYNIWNDEKKLRNTITKVGNAISGHKQLMDSFDLGEFAIRKGGITYKHHLDISKNDSASFCEEVLKVLLKLFESNDLKTKCKELVSLTEDITDYRDDFKGKCEKLIQEIDENQFLKVTECCPFHEYKDDMASYFDKTGLYVTY